MTLRRLLVVATLCVATTSVAVTEPASAEDCSDGVYVVVDARHFDRGISVTCVPASGSGVEVLQAAGHRVSEVPRTPGMICTIDGKPDPCNGAPSNAYWSYWHAEQGGSWRYSNEGARTRSPSAGQVEGWRFGDGSPPGTPPPSSEPEPQEEPPENENSGEEGPSGSSSSSPTGGSESSGSSTDDSNGGAGSGSGGDRESGAAGGSGSSDGEDPAQSATDTDETDDAVEPEDPEPSRVIEPAEPDPEVPVDGTAGYRSPEPEDEAADEPDDEHQRQTGDDGEALAFVEDDRGAPLGLLAGGLLLAGLFGLTAKQVRQRRRAD